MAAKNLKGITIEIGGDTTKLDKALSDSTKQSKSLSGELKQIDRALKFDPSNVELLTQKQQVLTEQIGATGDQLRILRDAQAQVEAQFQSGEIGADQYRAFQREIQITEGRLQSLEKQLDSTGAQLAGIGSDTGKAVSALDDLSETIDAQEKELSDLKQAYMNAVFEYGANSKEAKTLANEMRNLNSELAGNKATMQDLEGKAGQLSTALGDTGDAAEDAKGGFTIMKGAIADMVSNVIQSAIGAVKDFIGSLFELSEATEEYRQNQAKLEGSATQFGYSMDFASEKYKTLFSYVNDPQMATNAITNLMGLGLATDDVSKLTDGAIATWTAYGDSIPIESLTESIAETVNVGQVTGTLADTINWASRTNEDWNTILGEGSEAQKAFNKSLKDGESSEDAFSAALAATSDKTERARMVADLLNGTYGESKKIYDETAGSMIEAHEAQADLTEAQAELGEAMEPVNTVFAEFKTKALEAVTPLVKDLAQGFLDLLNYMQQNPAVMTAVVAAVTGLATAFAVLAGALAIQGLINGVAAAVAFLNTTLLANPIVLIVAAIAGLVAAFVLLWNNCEGFRNFWIGLWEGIKEVFGVVVTWLQETFTAFSEWFSATWEAIRTSVSAVMDAIKAVFETVWNAIKAVIEGVITVIAVIIGTYLYAWKTVIETVLNAIKAVFTAIWNAIGDTVMSVLNTIKSVITTVWNAISSVISSVLNTIRSIVTTAWNAISSVTSSVFNTIRSVASSVWNAISSVISSAINSARNVVSSVVNGISSTVSSVWNSIKSVTSSVWNGIKSAIETPMNSAKSFIKGVIDTIKGFFNFKISWPKIPMPHFSIKPAGWSVGDLLKGSIPRLGIDWYAKGAILKRPTPFGVNQNGELMVGGEAGTEAIAPISDLLHYVKAGVLEAMGAARYDTVDGMAVDRSIAESDGSGQGMIAQLVQLVGYYMPKLIEASRHAILLDGKTLVGETIRDYDAAMAELSKLKERGA